MAKWKIATDNDILIFYGNCPRKHYLMRRFGKVEVPQEAFIAVLKLND